MKTPIFVRELTDGERQELGFAMGRTGRDATAMMDAYVLAGLKTACDLSWMEGKGLILPYSLTALVELGLTRAQFDVDPVVDRLLEAPFDANCGDLNALRAMVMLGHGSDERVQRRLAHANEVRLPDGWWLCLHPLDKMNLTPKSCIKAAMHGLLLAAELRRRGLHMPGSKELIGYFLKRNLFYRSDALPSPDNPGRLALTSRPGWRMTDAFSPSEVMRVGLPMLLDALAVLGAGQAPELDEAWRLLQQKKDAQGRVLLEGTLTKSYLPRERVGKPSKWTTLYAYLAWQNRALCAPPTA